MKFKEIVWLDGDELLIRFVTKGQFERFIVLDKELALIVNQELTKALEEKIDGIEPNVH